MIRHRNVFTAAAVFAAMLAVPGSASADPPWKTTGLGEPYDSWNATVAPLAAAPGILTLDFDSPALGFRARSMVILPSVYDGTTPVPVAYYLHGTRNFSGVYHGPHASIRSAAIEVALRANTEASVGRLTELGVPFAFVRRGGTHGQNNGETYRRFFMPRMNARFTSSLPDPSAVSFRSIDRMFSAWGYDVSVVRPNTEFLHLLGARTDGRNVILAGTGTVHITLPTSFASGTVHTVVIAPEGVEGTLRDVTADASGRLTLDVALGEPRTTDEREALVNAGKFDFPRTRIEVLH